MSTLAWVVFVVAAGIGAPARYLVDGLVQDHARGVLPWGTFVVNVTGCFLLGALTGVGLSHDLDPMVHTVVGTGGLGAYTTFSTFTFETVRLAEEGAHREAVLTALGGVLVGLAAAGTGLAITQL